MKIIEAEDFDFRSLIRPFDLHKDIMCRFYIIKSSEGNTLFFDIHHIIFDGASLGILLAQINRAYSGEAIEPEAFSANDFALEERELLISNEYEKAKEYYQKAFDGIDTDSSLYTDKNDREPAAKELVYPFERVNYSLLKEFADRRGVRLSTVLNGAFSYLLSRYSGGDQSLFASFYHGRDSRLDSTLGMFIKTYPVYADFSGDDSISDFLNKLDAQVTLNRENSLYSYVDFCEDTRLNPSVLFAYQGEIPAQVDFCGSKTLPVLLPTKDAKSAFELTVRKEDNRFIAHAVYRQDEYDDAIIGGMIESLDKVLEEMLTKSKISEIDMLTESQLKKLDDYNHSEFEYEITDIVTLFRRQVEKTPDNIAVVYLDREYTYKELDRLTENLAAFLKSKGIGRNQAVSVLIPRCEYMPIASLGVLKSGAGYQPLDPSYPSERLEFMINDADAQYLIADRELMTKVPNYSGPVLYIDEIPNLPDAEKIKENPDIHDLFIMLYTSGSTGVPKGVMLEHGNLYCSCKWYIETFKVNETSRASAYASYGFDAHMQDMYPVLLSGGQLHIIDESIRLDLLEINRYFCEHKITHAFMTTQVSRQYAELFSDAEYPRYLMTGGEKLVPVEPPRGFRLTNGYGPTECTIIRGNRSLKKIKQIVKEEFENIHKDSTVRLMFQDEAGFGRINKPKYCWCKKGYRPSVPCHHIREYRYAYGAVEPLTGEGCFLIMPYCNADCMNVFLSHLSNSYPKDKIILVCDGAAWHKANSLLIPDNIRIVFIPPYTPEMNPIEQIWKEIRIRGFKNEIFHTLDKVIERLCSTIRSISPSIIKSITGRNWILSTFN